MSDDTYAGRVLLELLRTERALAQAKGKLEMLVKDLRTAADAFELDAELLAEIPDVPDVPVPTKDELVQLRAQIVEISRQFADLSEKKRTIL